LSNIKADMACIQETRWNGSGCKFYEAKGKRYKLFWMGSEERLESLNISRVWLENSYSRHKITVLGVFDPLNG